MRKARYRTGVILVMLVCAMLCGCGEKEVLYDADLGEKESGLKGSLSVPNMASYTFDGSGEKTISLNTENIVVPETDSMKTVYYEKAMNTLQQNYPLVHFNIISGDKVMIIEAIDRGLIDFGLIFGDVDLTKYDSISVPYKDTWGVLMRRDAPLANKEFIMAEDLIDKPLIISRQAFQNLEFKKFFHCEQEQLNIVATYNLLFNGSLMADEGMGYVLCFDKLVNVSGNNNLCFRPLEPRVKAGMSIVWKKYQVFSKPAQKFLQVLQEKE